MSKIKIGWSEVSIVPEGRRMELPGQLYERISDTVETPIAVTAMAMETAEDCFVYVSCDLILTSYSLLEEVRAALPSDCGFPKEKLMIGAIHTHTSVSYPRRMDSFSNSRTDLEQFKPAHVEYVSLVRDNSPDIFRGEEARAFVVERIVRAACEAWTKSFYKAGQILSLQDFL